MTQRSRIDQRYIELYDEFSHGTMSRREFTEGLAKLPGGAAAASELLPRLPNNHAEAGFDMASAELAWKRFAGLHDRYLR